MILNLAYKSWETVCTCTYFAMHEISGKNQKTNVEDLQGHAAPVENF